MNDYSRELAHVIRNMKPGERFTGEICPFTFFESNSFHLSLLATGNAFKTIEEAEANKDAILAKYQELKDRGLI